MATGTRYQTAVPAYGRDYKTKKAVLADWEANKDFQIVDAFSADDGRYVNKSGKPADLILNIRYDGLRKIAQVK